MENGQIRFGPCFREEIEEQCKGDEADAGKPEERNVVAEVFDQITAIGRAERGTHANKTGESALCKVEASRAAFSGIYPLDSCIARSMSGRLFRSRFTKPSRIALGSS